MSPFLEPPQETIARGPCIHTTQMRRTKQDSLAFIIRAPCTFSASVLWLYVPKRRRAYMKPVLGTKLRREGSQMLQHSGTLRVQHTICCTGPPYPQVWEWGSPPLRTPSLWGLTCIAEKGKGSQHDDCQQLHVGAGACCLLGAMRREDGLTVEESSQISPFYCPGQP